MMIKSTDKRKIKRIYNLAGKPNIYTIQTFAALVYLLLEKSKTKPQMVVIDKEYEGKENLIKSYIMQLVYKRKKVSITKEDIHFSEIGKKSQAHKTAIQVFRSKIADFKTNEEELIALVMLYEK